MNPAAGSDCFRRVCVSRRGALLGSAALAIGALLVPGCKRLDLSVLDGLAYALFPHPPIDRAVYAKLAQGFAGNSPEVAERLASDLPEESGLPEWIGTQLANPDFLGFRFAVLTGLYGDLSVTSKFGYQGPSIEFGGYLDNGFDDLDWLPEPEL